MKRKIKSTNDPITGLLPVLFLYVFEIKSKFPSFELKVETECSLLKTDSQDKKLE